MKAARIVKLNEPLQVQELQTPAKRGVIKPVIGGRFKLDQATEALTMLKEGKILGRGVINP
jgi:alcohol dehydrogenase, propanol-preferring